MKRVQARPARGHCRRVLADVLVEVGGLFLLYGSLLVLLAVLFVIGVGDG